MKRLTIIRHGKSSWEDPDIADFDRPLNRRGKDDAPEMGRRLASRGERPDLIVTSPAKRAVSTMNRIAREIGFTESRILRDCRVYEAGAGELLGIIREIEDIHGYVVLCGHNPGLTELCNLVSNLTIDNLPTCGVVSIEFPVDSWSDVAAGSGVVRYFDFPKRVVG
jgi:phosphohistidine phosphatase